MDPAFELQTLPKAAAQNAFFTSCEGKANPQNLSVGLLQTEIYPSVFLSHSPRCNGFFFLLLQGSTGIKMEE